MHDLGNRCGIWLLRKGRGVLSMLQLLRLRMAARDHSCGSGTQLHGQPHRGPQGPTQRLCETPDQAMSGTKPCTLLLSHEEALDSEPVVSIWLETNQGQHEFSPCCRALLLVAGASGSLQRLVFIMKSGLRQQSAVQCKCTAAQQMHSRQNLGASRAQTAGSGSKPD